MGNNRDGRHTDQAGQTNDMRDEAVVVPFSAPKHRNRNIVCFVLLLLLLQLGIRRGLLL